MMIKVALFVSLCCAQVAINQAQMGLMMKALGVEMPPTMPSMPKMPASLKAVMTAPQRRLQEQKRLQQQRLQRMRAIQIIRLREDAKKNPYSSRRVNKSTNRQPTNKSQINYQPSSRYTNRRIYRKPVYSNAYQTAARPQNSVYSPANSVRRPSSQQLVGVKPANPYSVQQRTTQQRTTPQRTTQQQQHITQQRTTQQLTTQQRATQQRATQQRATQQRATQQRTTVAKSSNNPYTVRATAKPAGNPYSTSRAVSSNLPGVRNKAIMDRNTLERQRQQRMQQMQMQARMRMKSAMKSTKMVAMVKKVMDQPKKAAVAMGAGCVNPGGPTATITQFSTCKSPAIRMMCTMSMKSCVTVGIGAMCCPPGVNRVTMDAMSYMNKMQKFMQQIEGMMK